MNANRYATKKTVAQGMLDVALLTANTAQLKSLILRGAQQEFYTLLLVLLSLSIGLQIMVGVLFLLLGFINVNDQKNHRLADILNNVSTAAVFGITVVNVMAASFDGRDGAVGLMLQQPPNLGKPSGPQ
ncbi:ninjurin-1-like [Dermacentor andersoni]|uniref:ninjurin-1-like n=1 Tax=Dermacentor andersoni TaxID=34620 RepID=UPI002155F1F6|nr:ninjurin-1-like [Dermacentor andersoni]